MNPVLELGAVVIDCADPVPVAAFYAAAVGGDISRSDADSAWVLFGATTVIFRQVAHYRAPTWPSEDVPLQAHLDFIVDDLNEAEARLHGYGAITSEHQPDNDPGLRVVLDPAGRPFCIITRV